MKTASFTAIYFDYALNDAKAYIATLGAGLQLTGLSVVMNEAGADGFADWTATVSYKEVAVAAPVEEVVEEAPVDAKAKYEADVRAFVALLQARETNNGGQFPATFGVMFGPKFARITRSTSPSSRSAFGFVDASGNLLKAAGWAGPAKNFTRGNIYNINPLQNISLYSIQ